MKQEDSPGTGRGNDTRRRPRRHDPARRTRLLDATLDVLVSDGAAGLTHRKVAARADVPLGSVTYHFASLAELQAAAFARYVALRTEEFAAAFAEVPDRAGLLDVLVAQVREVTERRRSAVLGFELHLAALRDPGLRSLTEEWTAASRTVLARLTGPATANRVDALLEGLILRALLATAPEPEEETRAALSALLDPPA
ncbi:TetR family transcriptional regulator [Streptomyces sp. NPDC004959]|uniref:TetR/AcrR family transcriptional regulator n=1 Tax=Streptomyces sp. NPDC004959 TaxID=3154673 RepID=UPI0033B4245C